MGIMGSPEEKLAAAIAAREPQVRLERCTGSVEKLVARALQKDPRLLAFLEKWEASWQKSGLVQILYTYDLTIHYRADAPADVGDVLTDADAPDAEALLSHPLVTLTPDRYLSMLEEGAARTCAQQEGGCGWDAASYGFGKVSEYTLIRVIRKYIAEPALLARYRSRAAFEAKQVWRKILGRAEVPAFVKPFLALSWLMQECAYDEAAAAEAEASPRGPVSDPVPHLAYGPLVERRGSCGGIAWAFLYLMREAGIECCCVSGAMRGKEEVGHLWNLVKLEGMYYHVDATWSIGQGGVFLGGLMKTDEAFARSHVWDTAAVPAAKGRRFTYEVVEDFLYENGNDYLDLGADAKYLYPEDIYD